MTDPEIELLANEAIEKENYQLAIRLLTPLAERDSTFAFVSLGWIYACGPSYLIDRFQAQKYYEKAWVNGSEKGFLALGALLQSEGKFAEARIMFEKGKKNGGKEIEVALNQLVCQEAESTAYKCMARKAYREAFVILLPYMSHDSEFILLNLGWLYQTGKGGVTDRDLAASCYRRAIKIGSPHVHYKLGCLELEMGNDVAARDAFAIDALTEYLPAMSSFGQMLIEGKGGPSDVAQGMKILVKAAEQGHVYSRIKLLKREITLTDNIVKKAILRLRYWRIIQEAMKGVLENPHSPSFYEFSE